MELKEALAAKAAPVEAALREYLTVREPAQLYRAMAHIPLAGGKRLRPVMALLACELVGGDSAAVVTGVLGKTHPGSGGLVKFAPDSEVDFGSQCVARTSRNIFRETVENSVEVPLVIHRLAHPAVSIGEVRPLEEIRGSLPIEFIVVERLKISIPS
mgnify:CR=1 FL=1